MIQHFIITPFSYRKDYFLKKKGQDPLNPHRLEHRFKMFEIACLPNILNQKDQNFTWILIVDRDLPEKFRKRLTTLISKRPRSYLLDYSDNLKFEKTGWLKEWIETQTQYVITTTIGDDDGLFNGFSQYISNHVNQRLVVAKLPPILFFAAQDEVYWDFYRSKNAPLGYQKPRKMFAPSAAGFSVCCKYPEIDLSIFNFSHISFLFLDKSKTDIPEEFAYIKPKIAHQTKQIQEIVRVSSLESDGWFNTENFHRISTGATQTIITNHIDNIQFMRLFSYPYWRQLVEPEKSFPGFTIDFHLAKAYIKSQQKSLRGFFRMVFRMFIYFEDGDEKRISKKILLRKFSKLKEIVSGFRNLN